MSFPVVHGGMDLPAVLRRFARIDSWKGTQRVVVDGGLRDSRVGNAEFSREG